MNTKYFISLLVTVLILVSCKKDLEPQDSSSASDTTASAVAATPNTSGMPMEAQPQMQSPQMQQGQPMTVSPTQGQARTAKGMNPAHGQPGHRCDIAVGAPLNSAATNPGTAQKITPNQPVAVNTPAATTTPVVTAPGMNPPHGQEGHRCDITVGAPLSSPKASATPAILAPDATPVSTQQ